ncbi:MAG: lysostaphin resistance A-like protein [Gemmatimonadota bacterium]
MVVAGGRPAGKGGLTRLAVLVLASTAGILGARLLLSVVAPLQPPHVPLWPLMLAGGLLAGHWWTFRTLDTYGWRRIGLGRDALDGRRLLIGLSLGAAAVLVPSAVLITIGWLRFEPGAAGNWWASTALTLLLLVPAALWEELVVRGYPFAILRERVGARRAIIVTSVAFGLLHLGNPGITAQSIGVVTLAGVFLGAILVNTGSLYAAWAAHVAWNFVMSAVLHTSVSGVSLPAPNYRTVDAGPDWATGGVWGPEAGIFTAVALIAAIWIMWRPRRRGADTQ